METEQLQKPSLFRIIVYAITGLLVIAGSFFLIRAWQYQQEFYDWQAARPIDMPVNLSQPGQTSGEFVQTCQCSHYEIICLKIPDEILSSTSPSSLLAPLRFHCSIKDSESKVVIEKDFTGELPWKDDLLDGSIPIIYLHPFDIGTYRFTIDIIEPVPHLSQVSQRLTTRYMLCGMEMMPAYLNLIYGIACILIALVILLIIHIKKKRQTGNVIHTEP